MNSPQFAHGVTFRPRLNALFAEGLKYSLVTVIASIGYGKSTATACFAKRYERFIWVNLTPLHGSSQEFWRHLIECICEIRPDLEPALKKHEIPDTLVKLDLVLRFVKAELEKTKPLVLVFDDFRVIANTQAEQLLKFIVRHRIRNLCIVVLSSIKTNIGFHCLKYGGNVLQIMDDDLAFTHEEARELFLESGYSLTQQELEEIIRETRGWPVALNFLVRHFRFSKGFKGESIDASLSLAIEIIKNDYFDCYEAKLQKLILQLSLLRDFRLNMLLELVDCDQQELEAVENNLFVNYDMMKNKYTLHPMYKRFLNNRLSMLSKSEQIDFLLAAGKWLCRNGHAFEAAACYYDNLMYEQMLEVISCHPELFEEYEQAEFLLQCLEGLPAEFIAGSHLAMYFKATTLLEKGEIAAAGKILTSLEKKLVKEETLRSNDLLGEVYVALAEMSKIQNNVKFEAYYRKAAQCLPRGSHFALMHKFFLRDSLIFCDHAEAGSLKQVETAYYEAMPYIDRLSRGKYAGLDILFTAEKAFYTMNFALAKKSAYQAIMKATTTGCVEIVAQARYILVRTAMLTGRLAEVKQQIKDINRELANKADSALFIQRDNIESWLYINMSDYHKIHQWMLEHDPDNPTSRWGNQKLIYAIYLLCKEKYYELLAFLEYVEEHCNVNGYYMGRIYASIFRAVCYLKTGESEEAEAAIWNAYQLSYKNGILAPFVEAATAMRSIIDLARKSEKYTFDPKWLDAVYTKSSSYAKRLNTMTILYAKENGILLEESQSMLSKKEIKILAEMSQGLTREEIADAHGITDNTVNSHIKNIFNKLGATNGPEAIHIAHIKGILKAEMINGS